MGFCTALTVIHAISTALTIAYKGPKETAIALDVPEQDGFLNQHLQSISGELDNHTHRGMNISVDRLYWKAICAG